MKILPMSFLQDFINAEERKKKTMDVYEKMEKQVKKLKGKIQSKKRKTKKYAKATKA